MTPQIRSLLQKLWCAWIEFARLFGTVQMVVILTIVYWVFIPLVYIPFGLLSDPLRLRRSAISGWRDREPPANSMEFMLRQW